MPVYQIKLLKQFQTRNLLPKLYNSNSKYSIYTNKSKLIISYIRNITKTEYSYSLQDFLTKMVCLIQSTFSQICI